MRQIDNVFGKIKISASECPYVMDDLRRQKTFKPQEDTINNDVGVYIFWGWDDKPIRIGKAVKTRNRIFQYFRTNPEIIDNCQYVSYIRMNSRSVAAKLEIMLIQLHKPKYNIQYNTSPFQ